MINFGCYLGERPPGYTPGDPSIYVRPSAKQRLQMPTVDYTVLGSAIEETGVSADYRTFVLHHDEVPDVTLSNPVSIAIPGTRLVLINTAKTGQYNSEREELYRLAFGDLTHGHKGLSITEEILTRSALHAAGRRNRLARFSRSNIAAIAVITGGSLLADSLIGSAAGVLGINLGGFAIAGTQKERKDAYRKSIREEVLPDISPKASRAIVVPNKKS